MVFRIGGLASGMEIDSIVKDLMQVKRIPLDKLYQNKVLSQWKQEEYRTVNTKLLGLRDAAFKMRLSSTFRTREATTSDANVVTASTTGNSQIGTFSLKVDKLAETTTVITADGSLLSDDFSDKIDPAKTMANQADKFRDKSSFTDAGEPVEFTFTINSQVFTVDPSKISLNMVLENINNDSAVEINAFYDQFKDKVVFTSKSTGESAQIEFTVGTVDNADVSAKFFTHTLGLGESGVTGATVAVETQAADGVQQENRITLVDNAIIAGLKIKVGDRTYALYDSNAGTFGATDAEAKEKLGADVVFDISGVNFDEAEEIKDAILIDIAGDPITGATVNDGGVGSGRLDIIADDSGAENAANAYAAVSHVIGIGSNAELEINGLATERESNSFTLNGTSFTLNTKQDPGDLAVTINITQDVDKAFDNVMEFINKYNEVIESINSKNQEARYRDYLPLTEEQKNAMSEKDIERWEEKAKSGLLRGDQILNSLPSNMRLALFSQVEGVDSDFSILPHIGITTGMYEENGKLIVDEALLKEALRDDPDKVMALFNNDSEDESEEGLARKLYSSINAGIQRITLRAGLASNRYDQSFLSNDIRRYDQRMAVMEERLQKAEDQYWRQFTAMEKALNEMYTQSDWLAQQLAAFNK